MKIYFVGGLQKSEFQEFNDLGLRRLLSFANYTKNFKSFEKELAKMGIQMEKKKKEEN